MITASFWNLIYALFHLLIDFFFFLSFLLSFSLSLSLLGFVGVCAWSMSGVTFTRAENKALYDELVAKYPGCPEMWRYFLALTEVPRPSKHTERVSKWAQEVGKKLGGTVRADAAGNVAICIPATAFVS